MENGIQAVPWFMDYMNADNQNGCCVVRKVDKNGDLGRFYAMEVIDGEWYPIGHCHTLAQAKGIVEKHYNTYWHEEEEINEEDSEDGEQD